MLKNRQLNIYQNFITMIPLENDELEVVVDRLIILVMPPPKMVDAWMQQQHIKDLAGKSFINFSLNSAIETSRINMEDILKKLASGVHCCMIETYGSTKKIL